MKNIAESSSEDILGYQVINCGLKDCLQAINDWIATETSCGVLLCLNPHSYAVSRGNCVFGHALHDADWLVPDGAGIAFASRWLNGTIDERITGSDIFSGVHQSLQRMGGKSVFFLGSSVEILEIICQKMAHDYPDIQVSGAFSPPYKTEFSEEDSLKMVNAINAASPDVLWVGMTAPKQEIWLFQNRYRLRVKFAAGIGAVFDFYAGNVNRSHPVFQQLGLEWLPRLLHDPLRLWRRTFVSAPIFLWYVLLLAVRKRIY
ncbi:MAG: WecB/TagA/CpsF family glycosyltransferase [Chlorobiaceae bacterium]